MVGKFSQGGNRWKKSMSGRTENHRPHVWGDAVLTGLTLKNNVLGMNVEVPKANVKVGDSKR